MKLIIFLLVAFQVCNLAVFAFFEGSLESQRNERRLRLFGESKSAASEQSHKSEVDRTSGHFDFLSKLMSHKKKKQQGYEAPSSYSAPQQSYGTPQQSYGSPQSSHGAPQPSHYATQQSYGTPQQSYGVPKKVPKQAYGAPQASYGVLQQSYGNPQQSYGAPLQSHGAPTQSYGAPSQEYGAPKKQKKHKHKKEKGKKHKGGYGAPQEQHYEPPKPVQGTYGPPNHPKSSYGSPNNPNPTYGALQPQNQYIQVPSQGHLSQQPSSYSQPQVPQAYRAPVRPSYVQAAVIIPSPPLQSNPYGTPSQEPALVKQPAVPNLPPSSTGLIYGGALSPQISAVIKNYQNEKPALPSSSYPVGFQQVPNSFASGIKSNNYATGSGLPSNGFPSSSGLVEQQNDSIDTSQYKKPFSISEEKAPPQPSSQYPLQGQPGQFPSNDDISSGSNDVSPENLNYNSANSPYSSLQQDSNFGGFRDSVSPSSQIPPQAQPEQFSSSYNFPSGSNTAFSETSQFNPAKSPYSSQQQESNFGKFRDTPSFNSQSPSQEKPEQFSSNYNIPSGFNDYPPYSPQQQESDFGGFSDTPSPSSLFSPQSQTEQFESNYNALSGSNDDFSDTLQLNPAKSQYSSQQHESTIGGLRDTPSPISQSPPQAHPEQFESSYNTLSIPSSGFSETLQLNLAKSPYSSQQPESNFGTFEDTGSPISGVSNTFSEVSSFTGYNEEGGRYQNPSEQHLEQQGQTGNQGSQQSPYSRPQEFKGISQLFKNEQTNNILQSGQEQANSPYFQEKQPINAGTPIKTQDSSRFSSYQSGAKSPLPQITPPSVSTFAPYYGEEQTTERIIEEEIPTYTPVQNLDQPNPIQSSYLPSSLQDSQQTYGYTGNDQSIDGQGTKEGTYQGFGNSFGSLDSFFKDMPWAKEQDSGFGFFGRDFGKFQGQDSGQSVIAPQGDQLDNNQFYDQSLNPTTEVHSEISTQPDINVDVSQNLRPDLNVPYGIGHVSEMIEMMDKFHKDQKSLVAVPIAEVPSTSAWDQQAAAELNQPRLPFEEQLSTFGQAGIAQTEIQQQQFGVNDLSVQNNQQISQSLDVQPQEFQEQQFGVSDLSAQKIQENSQSLDIQPQGFQEQQFGSFDNAAIGPLNSQPEANPALSSNTLQYKYEKRRAALKKRRTNRRPTVTDKSSS